MDEQKAVEMIMDTIRKENDGTTLDYMLPGYAQNRVNCYQSMRYDLLLCKDALLKLYEYDDITVYSCLYMTFIVLYGKCFTDP